MAMEIEPQWKPELIDLNQLEGAFSFEEGFSRPDWREIARGINQKKTEILDVNAAWDEAVRQWMLHLQSDLGGDYQISESRRFFLLAPLNAEKRTKILDFSETTLTQIRDRLQSAAWNPKHGKHVILLFAEEDDYYQYISYFYREGAHARNGGCLIHKDYVHIAAPYDPGCVHQVLAHELAHNCVVHLQLPTWLNEGLAQTFEHLTPARRGWSLDTDLLDRHLAFWNEKNIQEFWAGISWRKPGDPNELSYSLAEILLHLLAERHGDWGAFVKQADWRDAGQTAALQCLDVDLGKAIATFLGAGDWRPRRKAMVTLWGAEEKQAERKEGPDAENEGV
jgi:hypothetical protein